LDIADPGVYEEQVLTEAIQRIDEAEPQSGYSYELDDEKKYLSWVPSRGLR